MMSLLMLVATLGTSEAIYQFKKCLECFKNTNLTNPYFCNEGDGSCRAESDFTCNINSQIMSYTSCVDGLDICTNMTFTVEDFGVRKSYSKTLAPGWGCFIQLNRTYNGTWGLMDLDMPNA